MSSILVPANLVAFFDGELFGYFLHAAEIAFAELLFGFSFKKKNHFILRLSLFLIVYLTLSVVLGFLFRHIFPYYRFLVAFFLSLLIFPFCYDANIWDELYCSAAGIAMQNLAYSVAAFVIGALGWDPVRIEPLYSGLQALIYIGIHVITFRFFSKRLKNINGFGEERLSIVLLSLILAVIVYIIQYDRQSLSSPDFLWWRTMFIIYDITMLFMLLGMYSRNMLRQENAILDTLRASMERQYEFDRHAIEMVNIKCHDLKHQLLALHEMSEDEQEHALKDIEDAILIYDSVAKTGCKPLDVILSNKYLLCERYGIHFTYMIDGKQLSFMKASDVYSLFGNALDNAIRAEINIDDEEKRIINISVTPHGQILTIHIENYYEKEIVFKDGFPVTTQEDTDNHGFGVMSMKHIVEQYDGVISFEYNSNLFCLDIMIPIQQSLQY